ENEPQPSFFILVLVGLAGLTALASVVSLVMKMGLAADLLLLLVGIGLAFWQRRGLGTYLREELRGLARLHPLVALTAAAVLLTALIKTAQLPQNYDTGLYHAQAIRWMETYPAVPGLGNIHDRLAFNSSWLLASAAFSLSYLGLGSFHALDGLIWLAAAGYALGRLDRLVKGEVSLTGAAAAAALFLLRRLFSLELSSPGTDLPAALLVWLIVLVSLDKIERGRERRFDADLAALLLLALFAVTVKLSTLPVLLLPAYFLIRVAGAAPRRWLAAAGALALLVLLPWAARSVVLSGYLIYPLPQVNLFHPDWQIPADRARETLASIQSWARVPAADRAAVEKMPLAAWSALWYRGLEQLDRQVLWAAGLSLLLLAGTAGWAAWRRRLQDLARYAVLYAVLLLGMAYWFLGAPAMRFGYGFLGIWTALCLAPLLAWGFSRLGRFQRAAALLVLLAFLLYQGVGFARLGELSGLKAEALLPANYPSIQAAARTANGLTLYIPLHGNQCWYAPFPCVPQVDPKATPRGASLRDGFRALP
ncbi:MAG TPA: hypothetical protein VF813_09430, partial [Anaerolineaceae bacterium]